MKKIALLAGTCALFILVACGGDSSTSASKNDLSDPAEATAPKETDPKDSGSTVKEAAEDSDIISDGDSTNVSTGKSSSSVKAENTSSAEQTKSSSSVKARSSSSSVKAASSSSETPVGTSSSAKEETVVSSSGPFNPCSEAPALKENWKYLNPDVQYGCFKDSRDNQYYATVKIGNYTWMAENLAYDYKYAPRTQDSWYGYSKKGADDQNHRGYLYTWDLAMADTNCRRENLCKPRGQMRGLCPEGFHIPSYWEWQDLFNAVGGVDIAARELKSTEVWVNTAKGTNKYGFSVIPNGPRYGAGYSNPVDFNTDFWTSEETGKNVTISIVFLSDDKVNSLAFENKEYGFSVRCLMDHPEQETPHSGIPHDPDKLYQCDEMLMDDINTWHFKNESQTEFQYFIDDRDSISVRIKDSYSDHTSKSDYANNEYDLYIMFWAALNSCLPLY